VARVLDVLQGRLPDVRREQIEGAGHMLPITHPGPVADVIGGFLSR